MKKEKIDLILDYNKSINELINSAVQRIGTRDKKPSPKSILERIKDRLRLSKVEDWGIFCTNMDTLYDTSHAIKNFLEFKISGPTKYNNYGEKLLRFYGFLNAIYLQQSAVKSMFTISKIDNPSVYYHKVDNLKITELRHKLASHNNIYVNRDKSIDSFVIGDLNRTDDTIFFGSNIFNKTEDVNLLDLIENHLDVILKGLDKIFEKLINTIYKTAETKKNVFIQELDLLREQKKGNIVVRMNDEDTLIIKIATAQNK